MEMMADCYGLVNMLFVSVGGIFIGYSIAELRRAWHEYRKDIWS